MREKPELLVPAGSLENLKIAVMYGADAVYIGGELYGLRAAAKNFGPEQMREGIAFAHEHGVKVYVTANITAHNRDIQGIYDYFTELKDIKPDALIISDPGVFSIAREVCPEIDIHISTQANNVNYMTYNFWAKQGATRVVAGRELTLEEIKGVRDHIPAEMEIECFIHGAMCISYSGRCLLSSFMTGREANLGACTHPCRWKYTLNEKGENGEPDKEFQFAPEDYYLVEEKRPEEKYPVAQNDRGTYIFNSKDMCMIEYVPELVAAGINSFKIEGRMKPALYVAVVASVYREAIDDYFKDPELYKSKTEHYKKAISRCSHRTFYTGFYLGRPGTEGQIYGENENEKDAVYLGVIENTLPDGTAVLTQKNKFSVGDIIERMRPGCPAECITVLEIRDEEGNPMESCPHASQKIFVKFTGALEPWDILRK